MHIIQRSLQPIAACCSVLMARWDAGKLSALRDCFLGSFDAASGVVGGIAPVRRATGAAGQTYTLSGLSTYSRPLGPSDEQARARHWLHDARSRLCLCSTTSSLVG